MWIIKPLILILCGFALSGCLSMSAVQTAFEGPDTEDRYALATALAQKGAYEPAANVYKKLVQDDPLDTTGWRGLATSYYVLNDFANSLEAYLKLIELEGEECANLIGAGFNHLKLARPKVAASYFEACLKEHAGNERANIGAAIAADMIGNFKNAQKHHLWLTSRHPQNSHFRNNYALSLMVAGHPQQAVTELMKIAFQVTAPPRIRQNLALAYGLSGDFDASKEVAGLDLSQEQVTENVKYFKFLYYSNDRDALRSLLLGRPL